MKDYVHAGKVAALERDEKYDLDFSIFDKIETMT
jgi:hypothetical protein